MCTIDIEEEEEVGCICWIDVDDGGGGGSSSSSSSGSDGG